MRLIHMVFIYFSLLLNLSFASGDHGAGLKVEIKKGGAVQAFTKEDGFKLTKKAIKNLNVKFSPLIGDGPWEIPKTALVQIKHSVGVYRKWDGWITLVLVTVLSQAENVVRVKSLDLQDKDDVAISGVKFLRMTEADLNSDTVDSCAH